MSILIIAEHDNTNLKASTLNSVAAGKQLEGDVDILIVGYNAASVADQAASIEGVAKVLLADAAQFEHALAEEVAPVISRLAKNYTHVLAPATANGKNYLPRAAALVDSQLISDIIAIESSDTFQRPIYAGNVIATVKSKDDIKFLTVRSTAFDPCSATGGSANIEPLAVDAAVAISAFDNSEVSLSDRPELTSADIVVAGGRGLASGENFDLLYKVADKLNAAVGASRAAVDAGFVSNDLQVGQTGKIVAPELYIAVGISGAIQHVAGMKESKVIVAINKDEDAPIFQVADYGLVADLFDVMPELAEKLGS